VKADSVALRVLLVVAVAVIGSLSYGLLPFEAAGGLDCEAALRGADPKETATEGFLVNREEQACNDKSGSRLTVMAIVGLLYLVVGIGAATLPESGIERVVFGGEDPEDVYTGD
jgi:hypothetical protein